MKIQSGKLVRHNVFPPVEGVVMGYQEMINSEPNVSVLQNNGLLFWDKESTWDIIGTTQYDTQEYEDTVLNNSDIIDVEFREI